MRPRISDGLRSDVMGHLGRPGVPAKHPGLQDARFGPQSIMGPRGGSPRVNFSVVPDVVACKARNFRARSLCVPTGESSAPRRTSRSSRGSGKTSWPAKRRTSAHCRSRAPRGGPHGAAFRSQRRCEATWACGGSQRRGAISIIRLISLFGPHRLRQPAIPRPTRSLASCVPPDRRTRIGAITESPRQPTVRFEHPPALGVRFRRTPIASEFFR